MVAKKIDKVAIRSIYAIVILIGIVILFIIGKVIIDGFPHLNIHFLTGDSEDFEVGGGIGNQLFNSFYLLVLTLIISYPIAWGSAVYLSEYSKDNMIKSVILTAIEVLSSLPSIVVGLFGFFIFVVKLKVGFSILSGAMALTVFNLPTLVRVIERSLKSVDNGYREACLALGLTRWECVRKVLMPAALPGIVTGFILTAGRIFGEAAALIYTSGQTTPKLNFSLFEMGHLDNAWNIFRPAETLSVHLWKVNSEGIVPDADAVSNGTAVVLILSILFVNVLARVFGNYLYRRRTGAPQ